MICIVRDPEKEGDPSWVVGMEAGYVYVDGHCRNDGPRTYSGLQIKPEHLPLLIENPERLQDFIKG